MMARPSRIHAVAHQLPEIDFDLVAPRLLVAGSSGAEHLLDGFGETVGIAQHQPIELLLLRFRQLAALQGFQMQPDRCHRRLQFVSDGVDEAVVLLAAPQLAHQKNRIHHHAGNDQREKDDAEKQQHAFAPVEDDPADVQGDSQRHQANAQAEEEHDGSAAARDAHGVFELILPRFRPLVQRHPRRQSSIDAAELSRARQVSFESEAGR